MKHIRTFDDLPSVRRPARDSHKGQNGRLLLVGGSHLFHAASLWALTTASRIVDLVHYCSVEENNEIVTSLKSEFRNGIVIPRSDIDAYIREDDAVLIGPGMTRDQETKELTEDLLGRFPEKRFILDAGSLQMTDVAYIPQGAILTPHQGEFLGLWMRANEADPSGFPSMEKPDAGSVSRFAVRYKCTVLLKGAEDILCGPNGDCATIHGGNAGMTKGGTGDVLSGLIAGLACKNEPWDACLIGSFVNKAAGDSLASRVGPYFNASDLADEIPSILSRVPSRSEG